MIIYDVLTANVDLLLTYSSYFLDIEDIKQCRKIINNRGVFIRTDKGTKNY